MDQKNLTDLIDLANYNIDLAFKKAKAQIEEFRELELNRLREIANLRCLIDEENSDNVDHDEESVFFMIMHLESQLSSFEREVPEFFLSNQYFDS